MSRTSATMRGRRNANAGMLDTCTVTRISRDEQGRVVESTVAGVVTVEREQVYEGKAKRQTYEGHEQNPSAGEKTRTIQRYSVHFPVGAFVPEIGDVIEWTACPFDPDREGTKDRITALFNKSLATAMRVFVDEEVV